MTAISCAEALVRSLINLEIDTIFGIPGAHTYDFYDSLALHDNEIKHYLTRHEQGAGYMAYGYARSSGRPGVYTCVPGPGLLNTTAALCTAYGANAPVLCITGEIPANMIGKGRGILHELPDQLALLKLLTKWSARIDSPTETAGVVSEAFRQMISGRKRPVAIEVPWDVFGLKAEVDPAIRLEMMTSPRPDPDLLEQAIILINESSHPMIMVGGGAVDAGPEILALAEMIQAPVTSFRSGRGIVSDDSPYGLTCAAAYKLWSDTDLLIGIGSRLELQYLRWKCLPEDLKVIRIDIDPAEMVRVEPDLGIVCDAREGCLELQRLLSSKLARRPSREQQFIDVKEATLGEIQKVQPQMSYLNVIREVLPRDGYFVEEISQVGMTAYFGFPSYAPRHFVSGGYQANLGFGFQTALGVKVAHPDKCVVSVTGDGGFMWGVQELATAVHHNINLVTVLFNNNAFGNVRRDQTERYEGRVIAADLTNPDFVTLAESFGAMGLRARSPDELRRCLERAFSENLPVLIEVPCETDAEVSPWEFLEPQR